LAAYIRENNFQSKRQLLSGRTGDDPMPYDYVKVYGSWSNAMKEIWHDVKSKFDREYIVRAIIEFGLWTRAAYMKKRAERPDILPSVNVVYKEFGTWGVMKEIAAGISLKATLASYLELKKRIGRTPTTADCRRAGIILDKAKKLYGGKRGLDKFVETMEKMI
jgi:hypothetical protein